MKPKKTGHDISPLVSSLVSEKNLDNSLRLPNLELIWRYVVGPELAARSRVTGSLKDKELIVACPDQHDTELLLSMRPKLLQLLRRHPSLKRLGRLTINTIG